MSTRLCYHRTICDRSGVKLDLKNIMSRRGFYGIKVIEHESIRNTDTGLVLKNVSEIFVDGKDITSIDEKVKIFPESKDYVFEDLVNRIKQEAELEYLMNDQGEKQNWLNAEKRVLDLLVLKNKITSLNQLNKLHSN